ncbi:MAG: hypothetical protein JRG94_03340 [Deltaproteobacteria bacterium]|nr:hypothetical protein [Deltaproteobacteria bacterium]
MLAIYEGMGLVKLDKDSNVIWSSDLKAHHDLEVQNDGDIYVLTRKPIACRVSTPQRRSSKTSSAF